MVIEKSLLINLPERTDRLEACKKQIDDHRFPPNVEIVPAFKYTDAEKGSFTHAGERGCYETHRKCLEIATTCVNGHTLIMEDDFLFTAEFDEYLPKYLEELDKCQDWDMFFFYNTHNANHHYRIITDTPTKCMHFYIVNCKSAQYVYDLLKKDGVIDTMTFKLAKTGLLNMYSAGQQLVKQNTKLNSNIHRGRLSWLRRNFNGVFV